MKKMLSDAQVFRRASEGFDSGEYQSHYACDAIGWPLGVTDADGRSIWTLARGSAHRWQALKARFELFSPSPEEREKYPSDYPMCGWFRGRAERATALAFAAAMAATGDL